MALEKKTIKTIGMTAGLLVLGVVSLCLSGGGMKGRVEHDLQAALGVPVKIGKLQIDRGLGTVVAEKVVVDNPPGFHAGPLMVLDNISMKIIDFNAPELTMSEVTASGGHIALQVKAQDTNIWRLQQGVKADASGDGQRMMFQLLDIGDVRLDPQVLPDNEKGVVVSLPDIARRNVGTRRGGLMPAEMVSLLVDEIVRTATQAAEDAGYFDKMMPDARLRMKTDLGLPTGLLDRAADIVKRDLRNMGDSLQKLAEPAPAQVPVTDAGGSTAAPPTADTAPAP